MSAGLHLNHFTPIESILSHLEQNGSESSASALDEIQAKCSEKRMIRFNDRHGDKYVDFDDPPCQSQFKQTK